MEPRILLDTDAVVNWLIQETETASGRKLWEAPYEIVKLIEDKSVFGTISLTTLMEIRFLLRRKKSFTPRQIENDIAKLTSIFEVIIPDEIDLLKANTLQADHLLDPFDSIHLAMCIGIQPVTLISRDKDFIKIANKFITASTPEAFLKNI
jgi:PIN domain nuclease of toxin-antitoxin system